MYLENVKASQSLQSRQPGSRRYAIIGAGASGICAARELQRLGYDDITIYEIGSKIGGLWCVHNDNQRSACYETLHINTPREHTTFSELPFDDSVSMFPSHNDMYSYLQRYVEHFGIMRYIKFNSRVVDLSPNGDGRWKITTESGECDVFDRVIVGAGHLSTPRHASEIKDRFTGEYLHSFNYKAPAPFVGKRVCVVGAGNSAFDISCDICMTAKRTVLVARSGITIAPKFIFGHPYRDITIKFEKPWIPERFRRWLGKTLTWVVHGDISKLGFKKPERRSHNASSPTLVNHIAYRRVEVKQGIDSIEGQKITFVDGATEEFDTVICATGYHIDFPFISPDLLPVKDNFVDLYKRIVAPDMPGVYFIGYLNTSIGLFRAFERQTQFMAAFESGAAVLPSPDEMRADIENKKAWLLETYYNTPRHTIEEPHVPYFAELREAVVEGQKRAARQPKKVAAHV